MAKVIRSSEDSRKLPALRILGAVKSPQTSYVSYEESEEIRAIEQKMLMADEPTPRHWDD